MPAVFHAHENPVWRERADSLLQFRIEVDAEENAEYWEQLWARRVEDEIYEICCIPVFLYNLSLGDHVEAPQHFIQRVVRRSGRYTFRVRFDVERHSATCDEVMAEIQRRGHLFEWHSPALVAVDADSGVSAQALADLLEEHEQKGGLAYETGLERPPEELGTYSEFSSIRRRERLP